MSIFCFLKKCPDIREDRYLEAVNRLISEEKELRIAMEKIYEVGKIVGELLKYYAQNNKK